MLYLKKYFTEGLIQFTILLSLIGVRVDVDTYLGARLPPLREIILGPSSAYTPAQFHNLRNTLDGYGIHPKSVDLDQFFATRRLLNRVRQLDRLSVPSPELDTWLVHRDAEGGQAGGASIALDNGGGLEDVNDLDAAPAMRGGNGGGEGGPPETTYNLNVADGGGGDGQGAQASDGDRRRDDDDNDDLSKEDIDLIDILWRQDIDLGAGREVFNYSSRQQKDDDGDKPRPTQESKDDDDDDNDERRRESWRNGVNLQTLRSVDIETGESIPQQECLRLLEATFPFGEETEFPAPAAPPEAAPPGADGPSTSQGLAPQLDLEQQWQDIMAVMELQAMDGNDGDASCCVDAGRMSAPPTVPIHRDVSLHQASLAGCSREFQTLFPPHLDSGGDGGGGGSAPSSSVGGANLGGLFPPPLLNGTVGAIPADPFAGLLEESMLDEISLLDLAMEEGFSQAQASQLRDELDSDSGLSLDSSRSPASPSSSETSSSSSSSTSATFSEEGAVGYSTAASDSEEGAVGGYQPEYSKLCRMSFQDNFHGLPHLGGINHNHTYNLPLAPPPAELPKKQGSGLPAAVPPELADKHSSRDERRARAMKIPFTNEKIINLPVEEFNELLAKHPLNEAQLALVRDIRRRGKNKMAAQNCRKRKLDTIIHLEEGVHQLRRDKARLLKEKVEFLRCIRQMKQKMQSLCQEVFAQVRDEQGRPYPASRYSLQFAADGSVLVVPRGGEHNRPKPDKKEKKDKKK
ncbi:endoplasmic reticulum membrane sensor NFE2L1b [Stigmatopora argus]